MAITKYARTVHTGSDPPAWTVRVSSTVARSNPHTFGLFELEKK